MKTQLEYDTHRGIIRAVWCVDSESGIEYLINLRTNEILLKRVDGKLVEPEK
jgi:hypothetical protein